jgi:hypothetical protein
MTNTRNLTARAGTIFLLASAFAVVSAATAEATFAIRITDLGCTNPTVNCQTEIFDGGGTDGSIGTANLITFSGTVGRFSIGLESAITNNPGTASVATLSITGNTISNVNGSGGPAFLNTSNNATDRTLRIEVAADGFTAPTASPLTLSNSASGTSTTQITPAASLASFGAGDDADVLYGIGVATGTSTCTYTTGLTGTCAPSPAAETVAFPQAVPFSLYANTELTMRGSASGSRSVNYTQTVAATNVPEPATMALFGTGLFGFAVAMRRRFRK